MPYIMRPLSSLKETEEREALSFKTALETVVILFALPVVLYFLSRLALRELGPLAFMSFSLFAAPTFYFLTSLWGVVCITLPLLLSHKLRARIPLAKKDIWATSATAGLLAFALGGATGFLEFYGRYLAQI